MATGKVDAMNRKTLSLKRIKTLVDAAWRTLESACGSSTETGIFLHEALEVASKQERQHRAMGARFTHGQARYRVSCDYAAKAIILSHFGRGMPPPSTWQEACSIRQDCALAYALREILDRTHPHVADAVQEAASIDYAEDIAA